MTIDKEKMDFLAERSFVINNESTSHKINDLLILEEEFNTFFAQNKDLCHSKIPFISPFHYYQLQNHPHLKIKCREDKVATNLDSKKNLTFYKSPLVQKKKSNA